MTARGRIPYPVRVVPMACLVLLAAAGPAAAEPPPPGESAAGCDETLLSTRDLRICRGVDRFGRATTILTNLDDEGNPLLPAGEATARRPETRARETDYAPAPDPEAGRAAAAGGEGAEVRVSFRTGEGEERPAGAGDVEVRSDDAGGTTIVININNHPPAPPAPPAGAVVALPFGLYGGIVGPFRYPDRHYFLGYGPGIRSPSSFSALGLRASDRFAFPEAEGPQ
jgi:hypothetical protein